MLNRSCKLDYSFTLVIYPGICVKVLTLCNQHKVCKNSLLVYSPCCLELD